MKEMASLNAFVSIEEYNRLEEKANDFDKKRSSGTELRFILLFLLLQDKMLVCWEGFLLQ